MSMVLKCTYIDGEWHTEYMGSWRKEVTAQRFCDIANEKLDFTYAKKIEKEIKLKAEKDLGIILPKKKPLIAGAKKTDTAKKSKYYNKKDFEIAKKAISEMKQAKWPNALKTAKRAKDKSIYNFIQWRHLLTKGNKASYYEYKTFIDINKDYPRIGRIKYLAEHKLSTDKVSPKKIIDFFSSNKPLSGFGEMILGESFILSGDKEKGIGLIKKGWITKKKNLITTNSKFENIVYMHDYLLLHKNWYKGYIKFGNNFDIAMNKIVNPDNTRYRDWTLWPHNENFIDEIIKDNSCLLPYSVLDLSKYMYISGAYWVAKRDVMEEFPLDEDLLWGQGEDVEWSKRIRNKYRFSFNKYSKSSFNFSIGSQ